MPASYYSGRLVAGKAHVRAHTSAGSAPLNPRVDLCAHSGHFRWSHPGSAALQLSLAILCDAIGDQRALAIYHSFRFKVVQRLKGEAWIMRRDEVLSVVGQLEAQRRGVA